MAGLPNNPTKPVPAQEERGGVGTDATTALSAIGAPKPARETPQRYRGLRSAAHAIGSSIVNNPPVDRVGWFARRFPYFQNSPRRIDSA